MVSWLPETVGSLLGVFRDASKDRLGDLIPSSRLKEALGSAFLRWCPAIVPMSRSCFLTTGITS